MEDDELGSGKGVNPLREARLVSAGRILLDHAFLNRSIDNAERYRQERFRLCRFASGYRCAQLLQLRFQPVPVHLINQPSALALSISFDCRYMVSHQDLLEKPQS